MAEIDPRVYAIRCHPLVGRGSCSRIDECFSDSDIVEMLDDDSFGIGPITKIKAAIVWALDDQQMFLEQQADARWGEDNDQQLEALEDFNKDRRNS